MTVVATRKDAGVDIGAERLATGGYGSSGVSRVSLDLSRGSRKVQHGYVEGGTLGKAEFVPSRMSRLNVTPTALPLDVSLARVSFLQR